MTTSPIKQVEECMKQDYSSGWMDGWMGQDGGQFGGHGGAQLLHLFLGEDVHPDVKVRSNNITKVIDIINHDVCVVCEDVTMHRFETPCQTPLDFLKHQKSPILGTFLTLLTPGWG